MEDKSDIKDGEHLEVLSKSDIIPYLIVDITDVFGQINALMRNNIR